MGSKDFRGEIWTNVDPKVLQAMVRANAEPVDGCVGNDSYSLQAIELVQKQFRSKLHAIFTVNGTGANMIAMKAMLDRYSCVICARETHINVYESGAFEYTLGCKILPVERANGKLTVPSIEDMLNNNKKYKYIPKVIALSQPTELGTVYTVRELRELADYAHANGMYLYVDGARIGTAIAALGTTLGDMIELADIDVFTIGGTKSGAMFGEMVLFRREEFAKHLPYLQKQSFQHFDKSKFIGAQFVELLKDGLWLQNAKKANENARLLEQKFLQKGIKPHYTVESNMVFVPVSPRQMENLSQSYDLHYWNETLKIVRFCTTANTTEESMDELVSHFL